MSKLHGNRIEVGQITSSNRNSLSAVDGHLIYNTDTNLLQYYNPAGWQSLGDASPNTKSDYPTPTGSTVVFTSTWPGSPSNLPTSDTNSTWTAPGGTTKARVVVIGGAAGHPNSYSSRGHGGVVDALIEIEGGSSYKCIVGENGNTGYAQNSREGRGANGCGGSPGVDSNDTGTGGAGSAFFYAPPSANSDSTMFPKGVLIAGGGGGGTAPTEAHAASGPQSPDTIGAFAGISKTSTIGSGSIGEGGLSGGRGGRIWASDEPGDGLEPNSGPNARGEGGRQTSDGYGGSYTAGGGGGAGAGGGSHNGTGEDAPNGRGQGYGSDNTSGAGRGGDYPMRGGNGFTFNGVNLGGGGGGGHGRSSGGGGWGGGGGALYDRSGGAGGSGAWGYIAGQASITELPSSGPPAIPINGGSIGGNTPCPTAAGLEGNSGAIIIMT